MGAGHSIFSVEELELFRFDSEKKEKRMMENNAPGRGKLKVTGIIYTVLGALSILGSLLILGAGGLLLASDNDVGLVLGAAAGVFSVLGAVSGVF